MADDQIPFTSIKFVKEDNKSYIYKCPICGDTTHHHGHLYINKKLPICHCFRCNYSAHLKQLEEIIHEKCKIEYNTAIVYDLPYLNIQTILSNMEDYIEYNSLYITEIEKDYFKQRLNLNELTFDDIKTYSILPDYCCRTLLYNKDRNRYKFLAFDNYRAWTIKLLGTSVAGRSIDNNNIRYSNGDMYTPWSKFITLDAYCIRSYCINNYNINNPPHTIITAEGVYDIIDIYRNRKMFNINDEKNTIFIAVQCSDYRRAIKMYQLLYNCLPKKVIVFADYDRSTTMMRDMFKNIKIPITINWPTIKDWNPAQPIKCSYDII